MIKAVYKSIVPERVRNYLRQSLLRTSSVVYIGNDVKCNCCHRTFDTFLPKGNGIEQRKNAKCAYCFSLERTRLLLFYLEQQTNIFTTDAAVLHFAPEQVLKKKLKKDRTVYIDADIHQAYANHVFDICDIPHENDSFDFIICSHVLGHVKDEKQAIAEMQRVLKPTGTLLLLTLLSGQEKTIEKEGELSEEERLHLYGEKDLQRLHSTDLSERLTQGGFQVNLVDYRQHFSEKEREYYQLGDGKRELIFVCKKQEND